MAYEQPSLVVDSGSGTCKAGFAGDHTPKIVFSSKVGRPRSWHCVDQQDYPSLDLKDWYAGDEADINCGVLAINYPVEKGIVTNWDNIEKLWKHTFNKLGVSSEERPILTDTPNNPEANREKMAEIMFETFNSPAIFIAIQGVLSLYSYGLVTGMAVDTGAEVTQIVPTIEGNLIPEATSCLDLGGRDLNNYLMKIFIENGISFTYQNPIADVCTMKEKFCYVASDFKKAMHFAQRSDLRRTYTLPDNQVISMASERFQCPEALFQPSFLGKEFNGVHRTCYDSIAKCDDSVRKDLLSNIVLSGGSSLFPGFAGRMADELTALVRPANARVNVMAVPSRRHNVWIGGSIVAAQSAFQDMWLKKQEYEECGPSIIHKKCV